MAKAKTAKAPAKKAGKSDAPKAVKETLTKSGPVSYTHLTLPTNREV